MPLSPSPSLTNVPDKHTAPATHAAVLGQFFTPPCIVDFMLGLIANRGAVLEPSCGDGAFLRHLPATAVGIEIDARHAPANARILNFFALPATGAFATIIGNPPYVRYQDIDASTFTLAQPSVLNRRSNLYLLFIERALHHLAAHGELIFITPRDFLKASSAVPLNRLLYSLGTITDFVDLGDTHLFDEATPNCAIWRFERDNFTRQTRFAALSSRIKFSDFSQINWQTCHFIESDGHLFFSHNDYPLRLADIAFVKVGAVSGADAIYTHPSGSREFVCSSTRTDGQTRRMIWCEANKPPPALLLAHKERLLQRKVRSFDETNWWHWGRGYYQSNAPRVYVNNKTRLAEPFFVHPCPHYDGSVLAIFPHHTRLNIHQFAAALNRVDWAELGFVCDERFLFTQRSLEQSPLPEELRAFVTPEKKDKPKRQITVKST